MNDFTFTTLQGVFEQHNERPDWVIEGMCPRGATSLLVAKPKVGKSTLKRNLCLSVCTGTPALGRVTIQGTVMDLSLEESSSDIADHYRSMGATGTEDIMLHVGVAPADPMLALENALRQFRPDIVFIDPLQRFMRIKDLNDYAQVSMAFEPLNALAHEYDSHLMVLHHLGKEIPAGALSDGILGSTGIFASVDVALIMLNNEGVRTLQTDGPQRFGIDIPATVLKYDPETGIITAGEALSVAKKRERQQAIIDALSDLHLPMNEIKKAVGGDNAETHTEVLALHSDGWLDRSGNGKAGDPYLYWVKLTSDPGKANGKAYHYETSSDRDSTDGGYMRQAEGNKPSAEVAN